LSLNSTRRFDQRAGWYSKYRPGYPGKIVEILRKKAGMEQDDVVADVGSGTGLLTKIFPENGNRVFAIEPNDEMRSYADKDLAGFLNFISVRGTSEHTTLHSRSVDLVATGQVLHWFDPRKTVKEFSRISKQGANLCVAYNDRKNDRFGRAYRQVIMRNERARAKVPNPDDSYVARFFLKGKFSKFRVPNEQALNAEGLLGRFLSASYMPRPTERRAYARLRDDVSKLFADCSSKSTVRLRYDTTLYIGPVGAP
jgi:SAM-dependent methyltransferase